MEITKEIEQFVYQLARELKPDVWKQKLTTKLCRKYETN